MKSVIYAPNKLKLFYYLNITLSNRVETDFAYTERLRLNDMVEWESCYFAEMGCGYLDYVKFHQNVTRIYRLFPKC